MRQYFLFYINEALEHLSALLSRTPQQLSKPEDHSKSFFFSFKIKNISSFKSQGACNSMHLYVERAGRVKKRLNNLVTVLESSLWSWSWFDDKESVVCELKKWTPRIYGNGTVVQFLFQYDGHKNLNLQTSIENKIKKKKQKCVHTQILVNSPTANLQHLNVNLKQPSAYECGEY